MKKFLFTLTAATLLTASFALPAFAAPKGSQGKSGNHVVSNSITKTNTVGQHKISNSISKVGPGKVSNYHLTRGTRFDHGFLYRGRDHFHWTVQRFDPRYGCTCYFDPGLSIWFYFCEIDVCYYPVSYCPHRYCATCVPVVEVVQVAPVCNCGCTQVIPVCNTCGISGGINVVGGGGRIPFPGPRPHPLPRR